MVEFAMHPGEANLHASRGHPCQPQDGVFNAEAYWGCVRASSPRAQPRDVLRVLYWPCQSTMHAGGEVE